MAHFPKASALSSTLAAVASSLLLAAPFSPRPTTATLSRASAPRAVFGVDFEAVVRAEDSSTLASLRTPSVRSVQELMNKTVPQVTSGEQGLALTRAVLNGAYPGLVVESPTLFYYTLVWCEELGTYIPICCAATGFRIALANPVLVDVEVITTLD